MAVSDVSQKYDVIIRIFEILKYQNIPALTVWPIVPITFLVLNNHQSGRLAAKNSNSAEIAFFTFWSSVTYSPDSPVNVLIESRNVRKIDTVSSNRFYKMHEITFVECHILPGQSNVTYSPDSPVNVLSLPPVILTLHSQFPYLVTRR